MTDLINDALSGFQDDYTEFIPADMTLKLYPALTRTQFRSCFETVKNGMMQ